MSKRNKIIGNRQKPLEPKWHKVWKKNYKIASRQNKGFNLQNL